MRAGPSRPFAGYAASLGQVAAEDVVHAAFPQLWHLVSAGREPRDLEGLLLHLVSDFRAAHLRQQGIAARNAGQALDRLHGTPPEWMEPERRTINKELRRLAAGIIARFGPRQRAVWRSVREEGRTPDETARALGITPAGVRGMVSRAERQLREALDALEHTNEENPR
jgi:RNA polymerase sigma factor (sigma-70 family)